MPNADTVPYMVVYKYTSWANAVCTKINAECAILRKTYNGKYAVNKIFVTMYGHLPVTAFDPTAMVMVDKQFVIAHPLLLADSTREQIIRQYRRDLA